MLLWYRYFTLVVCCTVVFIKRWGDCLFICDSSSKKLQIKISFIYILLIRSITLVPLSFLYIVASWVSPCSIEKLKFENIIFQCYRLLNSHSASGCSNQNRLLDFDILMLLGDNYKIAIYKNSQKTTTQLKFRSQ